MNGSLMLRGLGPVALLLVAASSFTCSTTTPLSTHDGVEAATPACIHYQGEARRRYPGYDHVVHVENGCSRRALCTVSTDVDPKPIAVTVEAHSSREVVTRRASPAREFTPYVDCTFAE